MNELHISWKTHKLYLTEQVTDTANALVTDLHTD